MKTTFIAPNGVEVEGIVLYSSPIARDSKSFVNRVYDKIVYAQNRLVKLHHVMKPDDEDNYEEFKEPQVEIISEYVGQFLLPSTIYNLTNKHMENKIESINKLLKAINAKNKGTQDTKSFTNEDI